MDKEHKEGEPPAPMAGNGSQPAGGPQPVVLAQVVQLADGNMRTVLRKELIEDRVSFCIAVAESLLRLASENRQMEKQAAKTISRPQILLPPDLKGRRGKGRSRP